MPDQTTHPSPEELGAYSLGQLRPDEAAVIESHISECQPCCETIVGLPSDDTFVALLQGARQLPGAPTVDQDRLPAISPASLQDVPGPLAEHPRYEIIGLIGKGGMGDVYKARHRMMARGVALKIINRELMSKPDAVDRFHREVKTAASLSHPNIVTAYDAEQADDLHFLVMEHVDGTDLSHVVKDQGALPISEACDYVRQAAIGLQYAHKMGMVHRDIKPHNLMVTADGMVKILDFGLASLTPEALSDADTVEARSDLTAAGSIMGTPDFISPEQADNAHQADVRSDIYSLGATLYYLLSGRAPFAECSVLHKLKSHAQVEPEPLEALRDDIPADLVTVVQRMIAKDPDDRFQSTAEVARALAPFADTKLTVASTASQVKLRRFSVASLALSVIAATILGVVVYLATNKGTVVIRTDGLSDAQLIIKQEGRKVQTVDTQADKDEISVRLAVGDYELEVFGQHATLELNQDSLVVRRGRTTVVEIQQSGIPFWLGHYGALRSKDVQEELQLTDEQKERFSKLDKEFRDAIQGLQDLSLEDLRKKRGEVFDKLRTSFKRILNDQQQKRLNQIAFQPAGLRDGVLQRKAQTLQKTEKEDLQRNQESKP